MLLFIRQGLRLVVCTAENLSEAVAWYRSMLSYKPYFNESYDAGFCVDGTILLGKVLDPFANLLVIIQSLHSS